MIGADKVSEDYSKVMTAGFRDEYVKKSRRQDKTPVDSIVIKNRFGPDGLTFPCNH